MAADRPRSRAGRFRPGAAASIAPYDVARVVRAAIEEARRAGLPYSRQTEHAVQAVRQIDPDLTAEQAFRAVVLERRRGRTGARGGEAPAHGSRLWEP